MAIIKAINSKASIGRAIGYITQKEKTDDKLTYGKDCSPNTAIDEMKATKEMWRNTEGRQYVHLVQSFDPKENVSFNQAHELGIEFINKCDKYSSHEVLMSTHLDKGHPHNHFIINSVNYENGKKLNTSKKELQQLKELSNEISRDHGLSIPTKGDSITAYSKDKYKAIEKGFKGEGQSYLLETAKDVSTSLKQSYSKESFIKNMEDKGYNVTWKDSRKNITFENAEGKKVRSSNLEKTFKESKFSREGIENEIQRNRERDRGNDKSNNNSKENNRDVDWTRVRDDIESQGNRVSEQSSNEVTRNIQQQVREVKERTQRATGESQPKDRSTGNIKQNTDKGIESDLTKNTGKVRERIREIPR